MYGLSRLVQCGLCTLMCGLSRPGQYHPYTRIEHNDDPAMLARGMLAHPPPGFPWLPLGRVVVLPTEDPLTAPSETPCCALTSVPGAASALPPPFPTTALKWNARYWPLFVYGYTPLFPGDAPCHSHTPGWGQHPRPRHRLNNVHWQRSKMSHDSFANPPCEPVMSQ